MKRPVVALLLALTACVTEDANVLVDGTPITSCDQLATRTSDQQACTFTGICALGLPSDPGCCQQLATCAGGSLHLDQYCETGCIACDDDTDCTAGTELCDANRCTACPTPASCDGWPCPAGTTNLVRNGCATCTCAPASECESSTGCGADTCYPGLVCAAGCASADPGCCTNTCAPAGCPSPAPVGCDTACPASFECETCITGACECVGATWVCTPLCGYQTGQCFQPSS